MILNGLPSPGERRSESRGQGQGKCGQDIAGLKLLGSSAQHKPAEESADSSASAEAASTAWIQDRSEMLRQK